MYQGVGCNGAYIHLHVHVHAYLSMYIVHVRVCASSNSSSLSKLLDRAVLCNLLHMAPFAEAVLMSNVTKLISCHN